MVNVQMCKCENVWLMCKCENVQMCKWTLLFAAFIMHSIICIFAHSHICTLTMHLHINHAFSTATLFSIVPWGALRHRGIWLRYDAPR